MPTIPARFIKPLVLAIIAVLAFLAWYIPHYRNAATQARVNAGQQGAALDSAKDAIDATARSGARETASEALTADNGRDIRAADGASERVKAPVDAAGRRALCQRAAYRNDPKCAIFKGEAR